MQPSGLQLEQTEQILNDEVLGQLVGVHPLVAADGKNRTMYCFGNMRRQLEVNTLEISLLEEINQLNEQKNELSNTLRQKKNKLDKVGELRLKPDPELEFK